MRRPAVLCLGLGVLATAAATAAAEPPSSLRPQIQADVGLAVIGLGYEHPVGPQLAVMAEAQIFGTYFLPWFDAGDDVTGYGAQVRVTRFGNPTGRGVYVTGFLRADAVTGGQGGVESDGAAVSGGAVLGWVFGLGDRFDLRVGGGVQYLYINGGALDTSTPFFTIDAVVGFRL